MIISGWYGDNNARYSCLMSRFNLFVEWCVHLAFDEGDAEEEKGHCHNSKLQRGQISTAVEVPLACELPTSISFFSDISSRVLSMDSRAD